jgi:hypothetical protein
VTCPPEAYSLQVLNRIDLADQPSAMAFLQSHFESLPEIICPIVDLAGDEDEGIGYASLRRKSHFEIRQLKLSLTELGQWSQKSTFPRM